MKGKGKEAHKKIPLLYILWDLEGFEQVVWREREQRCLERENSVFLREIEQRGLERENSVVWREIEQRVF